MALGTASLSDIWKYKILARVRPGGNMQRQTFTRADATTCATYIKHDGTIGTAAANILRIEWVDLDGDGIRETPGILLEGSRANSILRSQELNTTWATNNVTVSADATTAPDGTVTADKLVETAVNATHGITQDTPVFTAGQHLAMRVWFKASERTKGELILSSKQNANYIATDFDTAGSGSVAGAGGSALDYSKITAFPSGWWLIEFAGQIEPTTTVQATCQLRLRDAAGANGYLGDVTKGAYYWGVQVEINASFASSYIKTVASTVTRAADSLTLPFNFGPFDCTVLARVARPVWADAVGSIGLFPGIFSLGNGVSPWIRGHCRDATRDVTTSLQSAASPQEVSAAIPAGASQAYAFQFKNLTTGGQTRLDAGSGYGGFTSAAGALTTYGSQTLRVGFDPGALYGVLIDLVIARDLITLNNMLTIP